MTSCWGITAGQAGMVAQVVSLAKALKLDCQMKKADIRKPLVWLPNVVFSPLRGRIVPSLLAPGSDALAPPYPDLVISCGRRAALVAMGLKAHAPATRVIHIQDPQLDPRYFDLVVALDHDRVSGLNVIKTRFALHAVTPQVLGEARQQFEPVFAAYPSPRIAVLVGGSTNKYTLDAAAMKQVVASLQALLRQTQGSLLITPSRRTGEDNIRMLREAFAGNSRVYIYDFIANNPYMGLLALGDYLVVTNDSVNMMSEAHATGKPLYILPLPGHANTKPARLAQSLVADGIARLAGAPLEKWEYPPSDEMAQLSRKITARLKLQG